MASIFFDFFKVFFAILFSHALFALWGIALLMCNAVAKHRVDLRQTRKRLTFLHLHAVQRSCATRFAHSKH